MPIKYKVQQGDTLNSIAQRHGYKNYKDAGITSVPSGNFDLIRPGEEISFNDNRVPGIQDNDNPVVSSLDDANQFKTDSNDLDSILNPTPGDDDPNQDQDGRGDLNGDDIKVDKDTGRIKTGDALYDKLNEDSYYAEQNAEKQAQEVTREYESLFTTELAAINSRARAATNKIKATYAQRINEQKRINKVNVDRVRAYGLSTGNAMTVPIEWSDAITERERKGAEVITDLENQRNALIDAARAARDEGESAALADKLKNIQDIEDKLNDKLDEIEQESQDQYKLLREMREEQETEFKEKQAEMLEKMRAYFKVNSSDLEGMTPEEKDAKIRELSNKYGLQYYEVFSVIEESLATDFEALKDQADLDKKLADVDATKALKGQRDASAAASYAAAAKTRKQTDQLDNEEESSDFTDTELKKLKQAGLSDADEKTKLDFLYGEDYEKNAARDNANAGGDVKSRATSAGFDYDAMRAQGYSDDEIKAALDEAGV